jgi:hypothetical protein
MKCSDVNRLLASSKQSTTLQLPEQARDHLLVCLSCQEFMRAFNLPTGAEMPSPELLRLLEQNITADLRPVQPLAPRRYFFAAFTLTFVLIVALGVYRLGAFGIPEMSLAQNVGVLGALAAGASLLAWSIVQQMGPGSRHRLSPAVVPVVIIICLALVMAGFFPVEDDGDFWTQGWVCLRSGTPFGLLAAIPFWFLLRRGAILSPRTAGASTGLLAGLVGTSALEIHCPILDLSHILTWHLSVAILGAAAGFFVGFVNEIAVGRPATKIFSRQP